MNSDGTISLIITVAGDSRRNGKNLVLTAYAVEVITAMNKETFVGWGWFADTQVTYAYGLVTALNHLLLHYLEEDDARSINLVAPKSGFHKHLEHVFSDMSGERRSTKPLDQLAIWKEYLALFHLCKCKTPRPPIDGELARSSRLEALAKGKATSALTMGADLEGMQWEGSLSDAETLGK